MRYALLFLLAAASLDAQIGGPYPGRGGQSPGGPGIPWPHKRGGSTKDNNAGQPLTRTSGKLRRIDDKHILLDAPDGREMDFHREAATKFYRDSKPMDAVQLHAGDQVSVESSQDDQGFLIAHNVYFEKSAEPAAQQSAEPAAQPPEEADSAPPTTTRAPAPTRDPDDPGPPVLRHGVPAERPQVETAEDAPAPSEAPPEPPAPGPAAPAAPGADALILKARRTAASYTEGLPNYVCTEYMARYESDSRPADWHALDVVSTNLVYRNGREQYLDVAVNGKPAHKSIDQVGGAWSTGEFASTLLDLFSPTTAAEFRLRGESTAAGLPTRVYDFTVDRPRSHWRVQAPSQTIRPAYKGSVWIEPKSGHVLRIETQARALPAAFPLDAVEMTVDYARIRIGEGEYLLPVHAENLACQRGTADCSRSSIDFRNYHKYDAASSITFSQ